MKGNFHWSVLVTVLVIAVVTMVEAAGSRIDAAPLHTVHQAKSTGYAPVDGIQMYYAIYGAGEPVLLIHSGMASANIWKYQIPDLSKKYKVIVADTRGHGRTTRTPGLYGYDIFAADYLALLDYLKIQKTAIVGSSDGGIIGLDIAMKHPERVTKLFAQAANATVDGLIPDPDYQPVVPSRLLSKLSSDEAFALEMNQMWNSQPNWSREQLASITVPTAIVLGDHDEAIKRDHTEYMASVIPGAQLIILKNVGHAAMLQDPEGYTKAILDFLEPETTQTSDLASDDQK